MRALELKKMSSRLFGRTAVVTTSLNLIVKILAAGLAFFSHFALIRIVGASEYGNYIEFVTLVALLSVISKLGLDVVLVRQVARLHRDFGSDGVAPLRLLAVGIALITCTFTCISYFRAIEYFPKLVGGAVANIYLWPATVTLVVATVLGAIAKGQNRYTASESIDSIVKPIALISIVLVLSWGFSLEARAPIFAYIGANVVVAIGLGWLSRSSGQKISRAPWVSAAEALRHLESKTVHVRFVAIGLLNFGLFQLDTLVLAALRPPSEVGAYNMACNYVRLVIFVAMIITGQSQYQLATLWAGQEFRKFFLRAEKLAFFCILSGLIAATGIVLLSDTLMTKADASFRLASGSLKILALAHLANCLLLCVNAVLYMAKHERNVVASQALGAVVATVLYYPLIRVFGVDGAAFSVLIGILIALVSSIYFYMAVKETAINSGGRSMTTGIGWGGS